MKSNTQLMPPPETTSDRIRRVLSTHGRLGRDANELSESTDLYSMGLSSLASVNLMLALENEFDIEFPDHMLTRSSFESIAAIADCVRQLHGG